jgi:hypothetical protein
LGSLLFQNRYEGRYGIREGRLVGNKNQYQD